MPVGIVGVCVSDARSEIRYQDRHKSDVSTGDIRGIVGYGGGFLTRRDVNDAVAVLCGYV